jgi:osmotically-inducible protein OsmY
MITKANVGEARVIEAVRDALAPLHIAGLEVELAGGCICLRGAAACYDKKRQAGELAERAARGLAIENDLRVGQASFQGDAALRRCVIEALAGLGPDVVDRVRVEVRGGVVSLFGAVHDGHERQALEGAAWSACGTGRVDNHVSLLRRDLTDAQVEEALNAYVRRSLQPRAAPVVVQYQGGLVQVSGQVASASESQAIEDLLRWHDGVSEVVNRLVVIGVSAQGSGAFV